MKTIECITPSMTTGNPLKVKITGSSLLRRVLFMPRLKGKCYSERLLDGWKWRDGWFRPSELIGYEEQLESAL